MTTHTYVLQFTPRADLTPEDRRILKDSLGDCVRLVTEDSSAVAIDQFGSKDGIHGAVMVPRRGTPIGFDPDDYPLD